MLIKNLNYLKKVFLNKILGIYNTGVPHIEVASFEPLTLSLARPKSAILIYPSMSIKTFSGFKL